MAVEVRKYLLITDWIAKQKGFKVTPRELDIDPERAAEKPEIVRLRAALRAAAAQRDKAIADLALAQDALRKANERADKAEAYIAAQGRSHRPEAQSERFALLELE